MQLWPLRARGRGIDAVWQSNGRRPYAVIEAKASYDPTKSLASLLKDLRDKTGKDAAAPVKGGGKTGGGKKGGAPAAGAKSKQKTYGSDPSRTPMSKGWIEERLVKAVGSFPLSRVIIAKGYSRHVLFFSVPQALSHAQALLMHMANRPVITAMHAAHEVTREWFDNQIEKLVDGRQGVTGDDRNPMKR